jgi:hypothetical protein
MSSIVEFFIAPGDDAAAAVAGHGSDRMNEAARYGNFDPVTMLNEIASLARTATHRGHRLYYWWG